MLTCSTERPWGLHEAVRNDEDCRRCGWTAPGPRGDALAEAIEAAAAAAGLGWAFQESGGALAA
ncbi:MAG TPA: hypothetical protein VFZ91_01265 [Allosphingosinicella sp.]